MDHIRDVLESVALNNYEDLKVMSCRSQSQSGLSACLLPSKGEDHWNKYGILAKVSKGFDTTAATLEGMADSPASPRFQINSIIRTDYQFLAIEWTVNGVEGGTGQIDLLGIPNPKSEASRWSKDI
jgi:hypothetical protein